MSTEKTFTVEEKKEFALAQLAPYLADPKTCGYNAESTACEYLTTEGKMCVAGKNMLNPEKFGFTGIGDILNANAQEDIFKPEAVGILSDREWRYMQSIHDAIAMRNDNVERLEESILTIKEFATIFNLFTYDELVERAETLKASK